MSARHVDASLDGVGLVPHSWLAEASVEAAVSPGGGVASAHDGPSGPEATGETPSARLVNVSSTPLELSLVVIADTSVKVCVSPSAVTVPVSFHFPSTNIAC